MAMDPLPDSQTSQYNQLLEKSLKTGCAVCGKQSGLSRCSACRLMEYCCRDHQVSHRPQHESVCKSIKKRKADLESRKLHLSKVGPDTTGVMAHKAYSDARHAYVKEVLRLGTQRAVETAVKDIVDMLGYNDAYAEIVTVYSLPALCIRLGQDQEAYALLKRLGMCKPWAPAGLCNDCQSALPNGQASALNLLDPVDSFIIRCHYSIDVLVPLMLLKIRLLLDMLFLRRTENDFGHLVPQEILDHIQSYTFSDPGSRQAIMERKDYDRPIQVLKAQIKVLFDSVRDKDKDIWEHLSLPEDHANSWSNRYGEQTLRRFGVNRPAWVETPGAIGVIEELQHRVKVEEELD
ncbi:hypothetical protein K491DRAFT_718947 [Lophiostoma macrostomum CBS 122681]|uniref:MYND-type domain-containing protein n=1 Tax=Lophiostoma macrostomum CBS 122681 TaxID=1314788 RepID=A0A6A6T1M8_9PLEO|nr:hypothetical protein K491DRAFT_718947 [Lophiostoma macrostomum CBS 122681]